MAEDTPQRNVGDLTADAKACLADLLQFEGLTSEQWYMRLSSGGRQHSWQVLTSDSKENDARIRSGIARSPQSVSDLVLAFVGAVDWRGNKSLMASMQYFRAGYKTGLLFGSHLSKDSTGKKWTTQGGFLVMGGCQNIWI